MVNRSGTALLAASGAGEAGGAAAEAGGGAAGASGGEGTGAAADQAGAAAATASHGADFIATIGMPEPCQDEMYTPQRVATSARTIAITNASPSRRVSLSAATAGSTM